MKRTILWSLVWVVTCAVCSLAAYRNAYYRGYDSGYRNGVATGIGQAHFGASCGYFAVLEKLRAEDVEGATRLMERLCFDSAHIFYKEPFARGAEASPWARAQGLTRSPDAAMVKAFAGVLSKYRAAYRTNSADWDEMERKLEGELARVN